MQIREFVINEVRWIALNNLVQKGPLAKGKIKHIPPKEFRGFSPLAYHPPHPHQAPHPTSHPSPLPWASAHWLKYHKTETARSLI